MATGSGDDNFDWVTAQAGCGVEQMFQRLLDGARADVEKRNAATFGRTDGWRFELHEHDEGGSFEVARLAGSSRSSAVVTFTREGTRIEIVGDGVDIQITAIVGINPHGDCRYYVGEAEYLGWEVRKQALDLLFFEETED